MADSPDDLPISPQPTSRTGQVSRAEELFHEHSAEIERLVLGIVRDRETARDVLQATFAKVVELGHTARDESRKGWLFRVAYHEAITARRRDRLWERSRHKLAVPWTARDERPGDRLVRDETVEAVRRALDELPPEQRRVVWARLYEDKTFSAIAGETGVPLGTVLTRMRLALQKLKRALRTGEGEL